MPDGTIDIWVDSTFSISSSGTHDITNAIVLADADNIGSYTMPVVYTISSTSSTALDINVTYFNETTATSGTRSIAGEYRPAAPTMSGVIPSLVDFYGGTLLTRQRDIDADYTTGYNTVSGSLNKVVNFIMGREYTTTNSIYTYFNSPSSISGALDWWANYTNYTGELTSSGTPIPYFYGEQDLNAAYDTTFSGYNSGALPEYVDISFAGWVDFPFTADVYSADLTVASGHRLEVTTTSGNVSPNYFEVTAGVVTSGVLDLDVYCCLEDSAYLNTDVYIGPGRITYIGQDIYSTALTKESLNFNVDLYSLKISNFSLDEGQYTTSSGLIYFDATDDECPVSTSGTYFLVGGQQVSVTLSAITDGYRVFYDAVEDYANLTGPTVFTLHAENTCGDVLEEDVYLTCGYIAEFDNAAESRTGIDYGFKNKVAVRVTAEDYASCPTLSSLAWDFESKEKFNSDLGASITGRFHADDYNDMSASIYPQSTAYFYEKEFTIIVNAKDFAGNEMEPFVLTYKIEDKPEN